MTTADYIQIGILIVLFLTLIAIFLQIFTQNRLLKASILRDRMEMYWKTYEPTSDGEIEELHLIPEDYMDIEKYNTYYKDNKKALRRYISLMGLYEYLAFTYSLKLLRLPDPLTYKWTERWTEDLIRYKEFLDIHEYHKSYYKRYGEYVDSIIIKHRIK